MAQIRRRSYDLLLGSFVALGLITLLILVFVVGKERRLFDRTVALHARFPNVAGLAVGADVLLSGRVVGRVKSIQFPQFGKDTENRDMTVSMEISHQYASWIRQDSIARIDSKGLLGDKLINISIGSPEFPEVPENGQVGSVAPLDFNKAVEKAQTVLDDVAHIVGEAKSMVKGAGQKDSSSIGESLQSISRILKQVESGDGILHALIYDKKASEETKASLTHLNQVSSELAAILHEVKAGSGIAHDLIFTDDKGQMLRSLTKAASDLEAVAADVRNGKGSIGLLLRDPSLYNEIYGLVGNLRRNRLLKAVIRHGVSQSEKSGAE